MSYTLEIRAFFFNAKTDYLPYYKNFTITLEKGAVAKDMLTAIQEQNDNFSFPKQKLIFKVNGLVVNAKESIKNIVEKCGTQLQIDSVNSYRSNDGLKINDDDFMQSYALLEPYADEADLKYYKTLYALHYASESSNFDRKYIGDAILVLADKMIKDGSEHKDDILNVISSADSGLFDCEYENNLFKAQDYTDTIEELKRMSKEEPNDAPSLLDMFKEKFCKEKESNKNSKESDIVERNIKNIEDLEDKYIAYYPGNSTKTITTIIDSLGAVEKSFSRAHKLSGASILEDNKTLALKKAGTTLLDAYDSGVELLVVEDEASYKMFTSEFKNIEKIVGRKMINFELLFIEDFMAQAQVEKV